MARNVNKTYQLGNVTETPELNYTKGGTAVCNFTLATNESFKDSDGEWVEKAQYHRMTAWGKQAELICELVVKGQQLFVEGSINYGQYENNEGNTIYTTEIKLREFTLTGGRPESYEAATDDEDPSGGDGDDSELDEGSGDDGKVDPDDELPF